MEAQQEQENLLQLADGFQPYVLELPVSEDAADGMMLGLALVVFNRRSGIMLAVPEEFIAQEVLAAGLLAGPDDVLGPSQVVTVPAGIWDPIIGGHPTVAEGQDIAVLLVDCLPDIRANLKPFDPASDPVHIIQHFSEEKTEMFPLAHPLEFAAQDWVENPASGERVNYYSAAEEVPKNVENGGSTPTNPLTTTVPKSAQASVRPGGSGGGKQPPAKKKPTVANLASSVESLAAALPAISTQLATLAKRQTEVEAQMMQGGRVSALAAPLGGHTIGGLSTPCTTQPKSLLTQMPPPRTAQSPIPLPVHTLGGEAMSQRGKPVEVVALEGEGEPGGSDLATAVLAQSQALTALVGQIAQQGDPLGELSSSSSTLSSRGSMGRAKLQQELAAQKGVFFNNVCQNMSRRMYPSQSCDLQPLELFQRGVCATRYLERFGGFGKSRDLGQIAWLVAMLMDHLQTDNLSAAKDSASLLLVCLEQGAMDSGHLDIGLLLSLAEDPAAGVFTNRSLAPLSKGRSFAPLAEQRWISLALSYIKELDAITQKRADLASVPKAGAQPPAPVPTPKPKNKVAPKPGWKKGRRNQDEEVEE